MTESSFAAPMKTCPMCGESVAALDTRCSACGENFADADESGGAYADGTTERELRTFVGRGADYYLRKWKAALSGGTGTGFNLAAFLFSAIWFPYRKMYRLALILYAAVIAESIAEEVLVVWIMGNPELPRGLDLLINLLVGGICGAFANQWYLAHARKQIANLKSQGLPEEQYLKELARRGGTNLLVAFGFVFVFMGVTIAIVLGLELLAPGG